MRFNFLVCILEYQANPYHTRHTSLSITLSVYIMTTDSSAAPTQLISLSPALVLPVDAASVEDCDYPESDYRYLVIAWVAMR